MLDPMVGGSAGTLAQQAPFPYFGGKASAADLVWEGLGDVQSYVEPFAGSLAVLLRRPSQHRPVRESVNDVDGFVSNFWRAIAADPEAVAHHADWPVNERDLEARHGWLVNEGRARLAPLSGDPAAYDAQVAGWWVLHQPALRVLAPEERAQALASASNAMRSRLLWISSGRQRRGRVPRGRQRPGRMRRAAQWSSPRGPRSGRRGR